jgi:predicted AlkP superfamily pyrophosphatase or phosphodiesterase
LDVALLAPLGDRYRHVVVLLMDALSIGRLRRWISEGLTPVWGNLAGQGWLAPLTSIVPSTTSAVLTSLWTGVSAAVHGIAGYELWLKEYGVVANTILWLQ